jgi:hypothetical protein
VLDVQVAPAVFYPRQIMEVVGHDITMPLR